MIRAAALEDDDDPGPAVTIAEAARDLGCDPSTVRSLLRQNRLAGHRIGKGAAPAGVRVYVKSIRAWQKRHRIGAGGPLESAANPAPARRSSASAAAREAARALRAEGFDI